MIECSFEFPPESLFSAEIAEPQGGFRFLIVGGGLSGLLTALRLSRDPEKVSQGIMIAEASSSLGGRLFFSDPASSLGAAARTAGPAADFVARAARVRAGDVSGLGFEILGGDVAEVVERHLRASLSDDEAAFLDAVTALPAGTPATAQACSVVKKEITSWRAVIGGSSEILTRKEASELSALMEAGTPELLKAALAKEPVVALLETLLRRDVAGLPPADVLEFLRVFSLRQEAPPIPLTFLRRAGFELACELILRARGVHVRTLCRVTRLQAQGPHSFAVSLSDAFCRTVRELQVKNVVLAVPLMTCFSMLPRDHFSANQSRGILRHPPSSLVALEYRAFAQHLQPDLTVLPGPGHHLLFPVERTQGFVTTAGHLVLFGYLDYEQSLEAPKVREAVARMRRAVQRLLQPEALQGLAGQSMVRNQNLARERVVLLSVARYLETPGVTLREVRMGVKGLYCVGDNFTFENAPWKNVVQSVQDAVHHLAKG